MNSKRLSPESQQLVDGMRLAVQRVVETAKKNDEELVIARDGKPVRVKARDL